MVDQIIDKKTVAIPGGKGDPGEKGDRGLPGVNAVENDTAVAAYVGASDSDVRRSLIANDLYHGLHAVFIGDSISAGNGLTAGQRWPDVLCGFRNWTSHNYSVSGTGFTNSKAPNFLTQAQSAVADHSYDHSLVKAVFVSGGVNDIPYPDTATISNILANIMTALKASFPNAVIYLLAGIIGLHPGETGGSVAYGAPTSFRRLRLAGLQNGYIVITPDKLFISAPDLVQSDGIHPNAAGASALAGYINSIVQGAGPTVQSLAIPYQTSALASPATGVTSDLLTLTDDGFITLFGRLMYTVQPDDPIIGKNQSSFDVGQLSPIFNAFHFRPSDTPVGRDNPLKIPIVNCYVSRQGQDLQDLYCTFFEIFGDRHLGLTIIGKYANINGDTASTDVTNYVPAAGDVISAFVNTVIPAFGYPPSTQK